MFFNDDKNLAEKCNLCAHRIDEGLEPFCVLCCEGQAIYFGDLNNPQGKLKNFLSQDNLFRLKLDLRTNPGIYYSPPKPKKSL